MIEKKKNWRIKQINYKNYLSVLALVKASGGGGMVTRQH